MFKKKYITTSKINYAFSKYYARKNLGEYYVIRNNHDRAVKCFEEAEILNVKAWATVFELYPKLNGINCTYYKHKSEIIIKKEA